MRLLIDNSVLARVARPRIFQALTTLAGQGHELCSSMESLAEAGYSARTAEDFDNLITGPLHGFRDAQDYYERSSSLPRLEHIRLTTLLLSAVDDPMLPPIVLEEVRDVARRFCRRRDSCSTASEMRAHPWRYGRTSCWSCSRNARDLTRPAT